MANDEISFGRPYVLIRDNGKVKSYDYLEAKN